MALGQEPDLCQVLFDHEPVGWAFPDTALRYRAPNPASAEINGIPAVEDDGQ